MGGLVKGVYKNSQGVQVNVAITENGITTIKDFPYETVTDVIEAPVKATTTPIATPATINSL